MQLNISQWPLYISQLLLFFLHWLLVVYLSCNFISHIVNFLISHEPVLFCNLRWKQAVLGESYEILDIFINAELTWLDSDDTLFCIVPCWFSMAALHRESPASFLRNNWRVTNVGVGVVFPLFFQCHKAFVQLSEPFVGSLHNKDSSSVFVLQKHRWCFMKSCSGNRILIISRQRKGWCLINDAPLKQR